MIDTSLYKCDAWRLIEAMPDKSIDHIITDPMYDGILNLGELKRICRGNIVVFCKPENQFFKPDEYAFWLKPPSPKSNSKKLSRMVEMILILRCGETFNGMDMHWRNRVNYWDDVLQEPQVHEFQKPMSLMERIVRLYSNPNDLVIDPFMGSGSTIKACQNLGRHSIGCEIDEQTFKKTAQSVIENAPNKACSGFAGTVRVYENFSGFEFFSAPEHSLVPPANR